jgi:hypothetical protein
MGGMEENPYESPEVPPEPASKLNRLPKVVAVVLLALAVVPSMFICGGATCVAVGVSVELAAMTFGFDQNARLREAGWWLLGPPIALFVATAVLFWFVRHWRRRFFN